MHTPECTCRLVHGFLCLQTKYREATTVDYYSVILIDYVETAALFLFYTYSFRPKASHLAFSVNVTTANLTNPSVQSYLDLDNRQSKHG